MTQPTPPRRVVVRREPPRRSGTARAGSRDIDEQTALGVTYMRSLMRTQLRLGLAVLAIVLVPLALVPAGFAVAPGLGRLAVGPVPVTWLLLGVVVYPVFVLVGWRYVRQAERNEAEFERIVTRQ
jgi:hypothetical protein